MEKDALIRIIIQDIRELETLLNTFTGKSEIPKTFIQLSRNKVKGVLDEIDLLEQLIEMPANVKIPLTDPKIGKIAEKAMENVIKTENIIIPEKTNNTIPEEVEKKKDDFELEIEFEQKPEEKSKSADKQEIEPKAVKEKEPASSITLGEKLMQGSQSFYDTLTQKEASSTLIFQNRPVKDIKSAIGINDRFYFQRELFNGDSDLFNSIIDKLNLLNDIESAEKLLADNFNWDKNNDAVQSFKDIVRRRYLEK